VLKAGGAYVPIDPEYPKDRIRYMVQDCEPKAILTGNAELPFETDIPVLDIFDEKSYSASEENPVRVNGPQDLAYTIYTSGTTGNSKGVMLSHNNLVKNAITTSKAHHLGYGHRAISFLPLCHVYERMVNYHFQYKGISIFYVENMGTISETVKEIKPHIFNTVPRLLEKIYDNIIAKGRNLPWVKRKIFFWAVNLGLKFQLRGNSSFYKFRLGIARKLIFSKWQEALGGELQVMVSGGAALQSRLEKIFWAAGLPIIQGYGLTETSPVIAVNPLRVDEIGFGTVGPVIDDVEVKIADDGEILCRGVNIMMGYYKAPDLTAEMIDKDGWLHTGDIGVMEEGKFLKITDRKKEMFKLSAGKYIAPQVIENKLKESSFIEQAMVIGENEKFASAILSPNFSFLHDWCSIHKIQYRDNQALIELPEVIDRFNREVKEVNKNLGEHEQIKRFRLVTEEWTPTTGELSPTLKLKRNYLTKEYKELIAEIYFNAEKDPNFLNRIKIGINGVLKNLPKF
jgi:long-chain acyl-CoA synthetase